MKAHCLPEVQRSFTTAKQIFVDQKTIGLTLLYSFTSQQYALNFSQKNDHFDKPISLRLKNNVYHCELRTNIDFNIKSIQCFEERYSVMVSEYEGILVKLRFRFASV
ncbi:MAG: hypothetical protein HRU38_03940 [Saccharospirillaceae bacterium]|nr:hypothetical protein [Pseudomonadales bacterium]NRB77815.1 hypothetical protein [Saccharospirillaceae bacterium]